MEGDACEEKGNDMRTNEQSGREETLSVICYRDMARARARVRVGVGVGARVRMKIISHRNMILNTAFHFDRNCALN
jgi:hypothetical protein